MSTSSPVLYNGNYYLAVNSAVTWTEALNAAAAMTYEGRQGHLVTITSAAEQQFVHELVSSSVTTGWDNRSAWIAATDAASEGVWRLCCTNEVTVRVPLALDRFILRLQ